MSEDGRKQITIEVDPKTYANIAATFDAESDEDAERACVEFARLAVEQFEDWITGSRRYRTLTEQYIDWVEFLYTRLLPEDEAPSFDRLYNSFNMTHGQAMYVSRVLRDKGLVHWRTLALREIKEALAPHRDDIASFIAQDETDRRIAVTVSKLAAVELKRICGGLRSKNVNLPMPRASGSFGDTQDLEIPAITAKSLIDLEDKAT